MLLSTFLFLVSTALANPVLLKREPSDKSGTSILEFHCSSATIPNPGGANGEGEGGTGLFNADMKFKIRGTEVKPDSCTEQKGYCSTCTYKGNGLKEDITAKGCNNPMAGTSGCQLTFPYQGYNYNSQKKQPKCGHTKNKFQAFSSDFSAICYFDV